jgi:hypothetical protein
MNYYLRTAIGIVAVLLLTAAQCPTPRMPLEQSQAIKRSLLSPGGRIGDYELDHIVPLCLCGSNDLSNLQLQPWPEARRKDDLEWELCQAVDAGRLTREEAVRRIRAWRP